MSKEKPVFCVMGAGHGGMAMAGHLGLMGFEVRLFNRTAERLTAVQMDQSIYLSGEISGRGPVALATDDPKQAVSGADVIMIVLPATGHDYAAEVLAPHLKAGQIVVLNPGRTFGALEFQQVLKRQGCTEDVTVAETQTFIFASRVSGPAQAKIFRVKNHIPLATLRAHRIPECLAVVRKAYPHFIPGDNVFKTSFNNIGAVFHPCIMLLNTGWVEDMADFEFYHQGITSSVAKVMESLDAERVAVAAAMGFQAQTAREWLYQAYDAAGKDLHDAVLHNPGYHGILAPHHMDMRYITEDVPCSLVPMACVGRKFGVPTPVMDSLINLASTMHGRDYRAEGRNLERIGIQDMDLKQIRLLAIGEPTQ